MLEQAEDHATGFEAPHAGEHGYRTIGDIMRSLNPLEGEFYREALQVSRMTREMFCLMEGRHVHPSTLYPGGVGTVATIADVLQARTAFSQAELVLETARGAIQTLRGALATAAGVSPNVPVDVAELPRDVNVEEIAETVDVLIDRAESQRPDLAAARFEVLRAQSHVRSVQAEGLPSLSAAGSVSRVYFYNSTGLPFANNYSGSILFRFPFFTGGRNTYETLEAREQARAAEGQAETLQDQVVLQVWTSYYNLRTAAQRVKTARDLLASATQSQEVAAGRYKAGVGSIIDLLVAQSAYANALAQEAQARSDWFVALAMLAHDTGSLGPPPATPPHAATPGESGGAVP